MFASYKEIFNERGRQYHHAMQLCPLSRAQEFYHIIRMLNPTQTDKILDIPSGGGYLAQFIKNCNPIIFSLDNSHGFLKYCPTIFNPTCSGLTAIPFKTASIDKVVSLAGVHHMYDKGSFFNEIHRILAPKGLFCLADVLEGSPADFFLNIFVNEHNSMGHHGIFLNKLIISEIQSYGYEVIKYEFIPHSWIFDTLRQMLVYIQLLFGLDNAGLDQINTGINDYLGYSSIDDKIYMNWGLLYLTAQKI